MLPALGDAIDALSSEIAELLSAPTSPGPVSQVLVHATKAGLAGIGGFVGLHDAPVAELHAWVLDAEVTVRVMAASRVELMEAETRAARDIIAADPAFLRRRGVLRIARISDPAAPTLEASDGIAAPFGRDLRFSVRYEHRPPPTRSEGLIGAVPQDVALAAVTGGRRLLYATELLTDPLADFDAFSSGGSGSAGNWSYDAAAQELVQTGTRRGGEDGLSGNKTGTYLVLRPAVAGGELKDFVLRAEVRSDGPGGIGLVFRYRDQQNFGFVLLEEPAGIRVIGKRVGNSGILLDEGDQDATQGFPASQWFRLRLLAEGERFELALDEHVALSGRGGALTAPGAVGFFCRGASQARFRHFRLSGL